MKKEQMDALIQFRVNQAKETLKEASILYEERTYRGSVNRSYYAMFYALLALLATRGLGSSKHSGAIGLFDKEFVKPGVFRKVLSKYLHSAFSERQVHDYGELTPTTRETAKENLDNANVFVQEIEQYLTAGQKT